MAQSIDGQILVCAKTHTVYPGIYQYRGISGIYRTNFKPESKLKPESITRRVLGELGLLAAGPTTIMEDNMSAITIIRDMEILCYCSHSAIATWIRPDSLPLRARLAAGCTRWDAIHEYYQKHQLLTKPRIAPDGVGQMTRIRSPHSQRLITVLLLQSTPDETTAGERLRKVMTDAGTVIDISADSIRVRVRKS